MYIYMCVCVCVCVCVKVRFWNKIAHYIELFQTHPELLVNSWINWIHNLWFDNLSRRRKTLNSNLL